MQVIDRLRAKADSVRSMGATALYLFGSAARDEASPTSDIDLFIDYDDGHFSLVHLVGIKQLLEEAMKVDVDITTRDSLHPRLREAIENSAVRVF